MKNRVTSILIGLAAVACTAQAQPDFTAASRLGIQEGGRKKPLDTFAREVVQRITGKARFNGRDPIDVVFSLAFTKGGTEWTGQKIIRLGYQPLKSRLDLPKTDSYFSYRELADNPKLRTLFDELNRPQGAEGKRGKAKDPLRDEANTLAAKLHDLESLVDSGALALVPHPTDPDAAWISPADDAKMAGYWPKDAKNIRDQFLAIGKAYREGDDAALTRNCEAFATLLRQLSPKVYPDQPALEQEITYNHLRPFRASWMLFLASLLTLVTTTKLRSPLFYWGGVALFAAGLGMLTTGFVYRCLIAGRPPVTNMYESVIWVAFGAALFALVFELMYRSRYFANSAAGFVVLTLILADQFPNVLDPSIKPLTPVLRDNFWLATHVLTITLGYAAFGLTYALGHVSLAFHIWKPSARPQLDALTQYTYRAMQVGVLLLAAGTGLGGLWANYSWGRFWGWDPKETWSLIALLSYLIVLHGRYSGWLTTFSLNVAACVCFNTVLMAWYGVNFVLGTGLHSYGFGTGGLGYVAAFVVADTAFVAFAAWRFKSAAVDPASA
ncbi:MAG: cytochrome c biogenesis protein CcsA [Verrucomicrobiia bacterium]|jgi:ABC-type transport system involved in cytochrome c biogenesis permease subunit